MEADLYALENDGVLPLDDGYRGIWYYNEPLDNEYVFKYSGGLGTYPQQLIPLAVHAPEVNKTFFCYGGSLKERNELVHCISWFDHATGTVPRPRVLLNKRTDDAHDNPTMMIDEHGRIWIFSNAHGTSRPSYIHRSVEPILHRPVRTHQDHELLLLPAVVSEGEGVHRSACAVQHR